MAAGYRSNEARWLGGASASTVQPGYRSICARWIGGAGCYTGPARPGYRSLLAYWMGGASSYAYVPIPEEPHGGGRGARYEKGYRHDEEDLLTLIPIMLAVIEDDC